MIFEDAQTPTLNPCQHIVELALRELLGLVLGVGRLCFSLICPQTFFELGGLRFELLNFIRRRWRAAQLGQYISTAKSVCPLPFASFEILFNPLDIIENKDFAW